MIAALAAVILFEGAPLPDGRREVLIQLSAPWSWFDETDYGDEPAANYILIDTSDDTEGGE